MAKGELVHRRGVLCEPEQRQEKDAGEAPPVRIEFLIAFTQCLIRECPSDTKLKLAFYAAQNMVEVTEEEVAAFWAAVLGEAGQSIWPKGFF